MKRLKYLKVQFEGAIEAHEIPAFRGAIANKVGHEHILFHNHNGKQFRNAYPLIQYKRIGKQPALICLGEGVNEIHHYFEKDDWSIHLSERTLEMKINRLDMQQFTMQVWDKPFRYDLRNWIAFPRPEDWHAYQAIESLSEKLAVLERKIISHIISMAKGIGWDIQDTLICHIADAPQERQISIKGIPYTALSFTFSSNAFLPNYIGLGGKVSLGFGTVKQIRKSN